MSNHNIKRQLQLYYNIAVRLSCIICLNFNFKWIYLKQLLILTIYQNFEHNLTYIYLSLFKFLNVGQNNEKNTIKTSHFRNLHIYYNMNDQQWFKN